METPLWAPLNKFEPSWSTQPEYATLLAAVPWSHDNGHSFIQHGLQIRTPLAVSVQEVSLKCQLLCVN